MLDPLAMIDSFLMLLMPSLAAAPVSVAHDDLPQVALSQQQRRNLIQELGSGSVNSRIHAITALGQEKVRESVPSLILLLKDANPGVRAEAAYALGLLKVKNVGPRLYQVMLHDASSLVRARATLALAELEYSGALHAIILNLDRPDVRERMAAIRALGKLGGPKAFNHLVRQLRAGAPELRETVIEALGDLGDRQVVRYLFRYLEQGTVRLNRAALLALTRLQPHSLQGRLPQLLRRAEPELLLAALDSAARTGCPACAPEILKLIETADDPVAAMAASTAAYLQMTEAIDPILARLHPRPNLQSRVLYLWSLGRLGSPAVMPEVLQALSDPLPELRLTALRNLRILRPEALDLDKIVLPLVEDANASVAAEALLLLGEYGHRGWLKARLPGGDTGTLRRAAAITSLGWLHPAPTQFLGELRSWTRLEDVRVRNAAIATLGRFRDAASTELLLKTVYSSDDRLRWETVRALSLVGAPIAQATLAGIAGQDALDIVKAYALLGARSLAPGSRELEGLAWSRFGERFEERDYALAYVYALALAQSGQKEHLEPFGRVFDQLLEAGANSSQKTEFVDLLFLFGEKWGQPWMDKALRSPLTRVRARAMVWRNRFSAPLPAPETTSAANSPVSTPADAPNSRISLPFRQETPREGCGCRAGATPAPGRHSWLVPAAALLALRRRRRLRP